MNYLEGMAQINYLEPDIPPGLPKIEVPLVFATNKTLRGYGYLFNHPDQVDIEIVPWPAQGWRPVDQGTGNQGGTAEGTFEIWWEGEQMFGRNNAVADTYLLGWSRNPEQLNEIVSKAPVRDQVLLWHANYHPDGGQLFFPLDSQDFIIPLALPGDDIAPESFTAFHVSGGRGIYIHPNVWHEAVFPLQAPCSFYGRQGKVHARVSINFADEFSTLLTVPLDVKKAIA